MLAGTRQKKYLHLEVLLQTKKRNKSKETIVRFSNNNTEVYHQRRRNDQYPRDRSLT